MDRELLIELLCEKYSYVVNITRLMGVDKNDREDVANDVMVEALKSIHTLREPDKLAPWLKTITHNTVYKYLRRKIRRRNLVVSENIEAGEINISNMLIDEMSVEKIFIEAEQRDLVWKLLEHLSDRARQIVYMRLSCDYKFKDIAAALKLNENTVRSIYSRSLPKLKEIYLENFGKEEHDGGQ